MNWGNKIKWLFYSLYSTERNCNSSKHIGNSNGLIRLNRVQKFGDSRCHNHHVDNMSMRQLQTFGSVTNCDTATSHVTRLLLYSCFILFPQFPILELRYDLSFHYFLRCTHCYIPAYCKRQLPLTITTRTVSTGGQGLGRAWMSDWYAEQRIPNVTDIHELRLEWPQYQTNDGVVCT